MEAGRLGGCAGVPRAWCGRHPPGVPTRHCGVCGPPQMKRQAELLQHDHEERDKALHELETEHARYETEHQELDRIKHEQDALKHELEIHIQHEHELEDTAKTQVSRSSNQCEISM